MVASRRHGRLDLADGYSPNLPADRDVYVEVGDEPWNFAGVPAAYWYGMSYHALRDLLVRTYWYGVRVGQIRARGRAIWAAAGRDPSHVKSTINVQDAPGNDGAIGPLLDFLAAHSAVPDLVEIAPYYDHYPDPAIWKAYARVVDRHAGGRLDLGLLRQPSVGNSNWGGGQVHRIGDFKAAIDAWNAAHAGSVRLGIYEYGPGLPWPVYNAAASARPWTP